MAVGSERGSLVEVLSRREVQKRRMADIFIAIFVFRIPYSG